MTLIPPVAPRSRRYGVVKEAEVSVLYVHVCMRDRNVTVSSFIEVVLSIHERFNHRLYIGAAK